MIKNTIIFFLLVPFLTFSQSIRKKVSTLFLGNSYTYVNNLPLMVYNIARANGDTLVYDSNTPGGYTLNNHYTNGTSLSKINAFAWQYVALQAQSQEPAFSPGQVNAQTLPFALKLDSLIKKNNSCGKTVFYETWGRKNGDAQNCAFYPPICTYTGMQNRLKQSYKKFADTTGGILSPAGEAFRRSILLNPLLELYDPDESHPSVSGSYLAACVFYEVLFQKSVLTNTFNPGITANAMTFLQQVAHSTVNDSVNVWNLGVNLPWADFSMSNINASSYQFQSFSQNFTNAWYFGDGSTASSLAPVHAFINAGTYTVSHVVSDACKKDSVFKPINILATSLQQKPMAEEAPRLYPNPCSSELRIVNAGVFKNTNALTEIRNNLGQLVYTAGFNENINTEALEEGIYFLKIFTTKEVFSAYFIRID